MTIIVRILPPKRVREPAATVIGTPIAALILISSGEKPNNGRPVFAPEGIGSGLRGGRATRSDDTEFPMEIAVMATERLTTRRGVLMGIARNFSERKYAEHRAREELGCRFEKRTTE